MRLSLAVTLLLLGVTTHVFGAHFRGGTFSWKPLGQNKVLMTYNFNFNGFRDDTSEKESGHEVCTEIAKNRETLLKTEGMLHCDGCYQDDPRYQDCSKCITFNPVAMRWICTDFDKEGGWDIGGRTFEVSVPDNKLVMFFESCCFVTVQNAERKEDQGWKMITEIDLNKEDNSSPVTSPIPVQLYPQGCKYTFIIPVYDPDGDRYRCRNTDENQHECYAGGKNRDLCGKLDKVTINSDCTLEFDTSGPPGDYAVRVIIEDLDVNNDTLSKISLSFLLSISPDITKCGIPTIIEPERHGMTIPVGKRYEITIVAEAGDENQLISRIEINKPTGMTSSTLQTVDGYPLRKAIQLKWQPTRHQIGTHIVGFFAVDTAGITSGWSYVILNVVDAGYLYPVKSKSYPSEGQAVEIGRTKKWSIRFNRQVRPPTQTAYTSLINYYGTVVGRVDSSDKMQVEFNGKVTSFYMPIDEVAGELPYTLHIDEGFAIDADYVDSKFPFYSKAEQWSITINGVVLPPDNPTIVEPERHGMTIPVDKRYEIKIVAEAANENQLISRIEINKPTGMTSSTLQTVYGYPLRKAIQLNWQPTRQQIGKHTVGFSAVDTAGITSGWSYVNLNVVDAGYLYPVKSKSYPSDGQVVEIGRTKNLKKWSIRFNRQVRRPTQTVYISLSNNYGRVVGRVDSSDKMQVQFTGKDVSFNMPIYEVGGEYTLRIDEGFAIDAKYVDSKYPFYSKAEEWSITINVTPMPPGNPAIVEPERHGMTIPVDKRYEIKIVAEAANENQLISRIEINKPKGMTSSTLQTVDGYPLRKAIQLNWQPTRQQIGKHTVGFSAVDTAGITSGWSYVNLNVVDAGYLYPVEIKSYPHDGQVVELGRTMKWSIRFNRQVRRPTQVVYISLTNKKGRVVGRVDSSDKMQVEFNGKDVSFICV
ncbi:uncharacterized protein [Amphiura filiformis]|uniref:uncharacterized protein n=1 Tax=Amphiura filiformis TaxID=82378 RepID=UPI003B223747